MHTQCLAYTRLIRELFKSYRYNPNLNLYLIQFNKNEMAKINFICIIINVNLTWRIILAIPSEYIQKQTKLKG